jgi:ATP-dependent DNA ligase
MKHQFPLPRDTQPMEAKAADALPREHDVWQYEPKWDGFRCLAFKEGEAVELRAKSGKPLGRYFPEVVSLLRELDSERFVVDGEIVVEADGELSFDALQMRLHPAESRIRKLSVETPAKLILFDILANARGEAQIEKPLTERRVVLEAFVKSADHPELVLSRCTTDPAVAAGWLCKSGDGSTEPPSSFRRKGMVWPVRPFMKCGNMPW